VLQHAHLERGDGAGYGFRDGRLGAAVDHARRQMPEQVEYARLGDAGRQA
jgi:hypothetical protein